MRYRGQEHTVEVPIDGETRDLEALAAVFHDRHRQRYTFALEDTPVEIVNFRVTATAAISRPPLADMDLGEPGDPRKGARFVRFAGMGHGSEAGARETVIFARERLPRGFVVDGPAVVEEPSTTTVVHPGQRLTVDELGNLIITAFGGD